MLQEAQLAMRWSLVQYLDDSIEVGEAAQVLILHVVQASAGALPAPAGCAPPPLDAD